MKKWESFKSVVHDNAQVIVLILVIFENYIGLESFFDKLLKEGYFNEGIIGFIVRYMLIVGVILMITAPKKAVEVTKNGTD